MDKLYAERNTEEQFAYYFNHVMAMTQEGLHKKSAIAAELAHRDIEIDQLKAQAERLSDEAKRLWCLLDDISTYGDMYKPEITNYFTAVNGKCEDRQGIIESDGYELTIKETPAQSLQEHDLDLIQLLIDRAELEKDYYAANFLKNAFNTINKKKQLEDEGNE